MQSSYISCALLGSATIVILVVVGVSADTASHPGMKRGTRLSQVDPDTPWANSTPSQNGSSEGILSWLSRSAVNVLRECGTKATKEGANDVGICLKLAAVRVIDKFSKIRRELPLAGGIVLVPNAQSSNQSNENAPPAGEMPRSLQEKHHWADKQLISRILNLIGSLSLRLQLPSARSISDFAIQGGERLAAVASSVIDTEDASNPEAGRRRGGGHFMNAGMIMGSSLLPIKLSMLALLVGKALMLSALAFVLPASRFLQSLASRGGSCH